MLAGAYGARMITVGLTGGIGSGKSTVARMLAERGAVVVDADALAREAVRRGSDGLSRVVAEFGDDVLEPNGSLDRAALGRIVFDDPAKRAALEAIVHPYVARRSAELMSGASQDAVVVYDLPLLVEKRLQDDFDIVVVVDVSEDVQLQRLVEDRGMDPAEARRRIAAQAIRAERLSVADVVLDNHGDRDGLCRQVGDFWTSLPERDHRSLG